MEKLSSAEYIKGYSRGGQNNINIVTSNDKIIIPQLLQRYVVKFYHTYLFHLGLDRTEAMIFNIFTGPALEKLSVRKSRSVACDNIQNGQKIYGKFPAKLSKEILCNKYV